jgi:hypothetical protein
VSSKEANERRIAAMTDSELHDLMGRTKAYAGRMISSNSWRFSKGGLLPGGRSAHDLVQAAFENILNGGEWDDDKPLWLVMQGFIRGCVGNLAKSWENRKFSSIDEESADGENDWLSAVEKIAADAPDPVERTKRSEDYDVILQIVDSLAEGSPEKRIAESYLSGASKRAEVLTETGLKAEEYEAAKKRLRRFLEDYRKKRAAARH